MNSKVNTYLNELNSNDTWIKWEDNLYTILEHFPSDLDERAYSILEVLQSKYAQKARFIYENIATLDADDNFKKLVKLENKLKKNEKNFGNKVKKLLSKEKDEWRSRSKKERNQKENFCFM